MSAAERANGRGVHSGKQLGVRLYARVSAGSQAAGGVEGEVVVKVWME